MRKLLLALLILPFLLSAQSTDTIIWSDKRLIWDNYKANYDTVTYHREFLAYTTWHLSYQYKTIKSQNQIVFTVYTWFNANRSWVRKRSRDNDKLLLHEQSHFDLEEVCTRRFKKQLAETTFSPDNYKDSIKTIFSKVLSDANKIQVQLDAETNHGTNEDRQLDWDEYIAKALLRLDLYKEKNVTAKLMK